MLWASHPCKIILNLHYSYILAERSQSFITTVVNGYDMVPRMTIRGLGHLALSVKDLVSHSEDTKQNVLCCIDCKSPEVDADLILQRQKETLFEFDVKCPGTVQEDGEANSQTELLGRTKTKREFKLGRHLVDHLAKLVTAETKGPQRLSSDHGSSEDNERHAIMFTPGRIMHLEVEKVDMLKK